MTSKRKAPTTSKRKTAVRAAVNTKHAFKSSNRWMNRITKARG